MLDIAALLADVVGFDWDAGNASASSPSAT
jgi:hypothetical protein